MTDRDTSKAKPERWVTYVADKRPPGRTGPNLGKVRGPTGQDANDYPRMTPEEREAQRAYTAEFGERDRLQAEADRAAHLERIRREEAEADARTGKRARSA